METIPATHFLNESEKPTGKHYVILGMSWAGWLFDFYDLMMFSFLLIPIKETLGLSDASLSLLLGSTLAATALGGILFGYLSDRFGRKTVLSWTILVYSLGTFACGFAQGVWWLLVFRVITGLGVGGEWATGQTLVGETFPAKMVARFAAVMQTGAPLGIALASVVGGFAQPALASAFGPDRGWRGCFFLSVLPALLVVVIRRVMPESDVWLDSPTPGRGARGGPPLRPAPHAGTAPALPARPRPRPDRHVSLLVHLQLDAKVPVRQPGVLDGASGLWMLVAQAGGLLGYLSFGVFADWKGRRPAYTGFSLIWAVGLVAITLFWSRIAAWPWLALAFMFMVGFGTGNFSGYGPIFSEIFPTKVRNTAMGTAFNLARGVQFFTPLIITQVATRYGLGGGISLAAFFAVFTGLWVWTLPETRGTKIVAEP